MTCIWNKIFANNTSQFKKRFPELYEILLPKIDSVFDIFSQAEKNCTEENSLEILSSIFSFWNFSKARDNSLTVKENGTFLHSGYSPAREVQKAFSCPEFNDPEITWIFAGIGLGYAPLEFAKANKENLLVIIEPDPGYLFASLCCLDWTPVFNHEKCIIVTDTNPERIIPLLENLKAISKTKIITQNSQTKHQTQWFQNFFTLLERNRQKENINTNTLERFSSLWLKNSIKNLDEFSKSSGIAIYKNMLEQKNPVLICAAGPTLEENIPKLKEIQDKIIIIAVDTALKALIRNKIEPDFILLIDPQYYAANHIAGITSPSSVLITESSVYPSVMRFNCRKKVFCESLFPLGQYFENKLLPEHSFGKITAGGSVSTSAWDFAKYIGASKIYMAGLDLGYPQNMTHIKGSTFEEKSHSSSTKLKPAENNLCSILFSAANEKAKNFNGEQIITDTKMKLFAWWFESQIAKNPQIQTFSLSAKSLQIPGVKVSTIQDLVSNINPQMNKTEIIKLAEKNNCSFNQNDFNTSLSEFKSTMIKLKNLADEGFNICQNILQKNQNDGELLARKYFSKLEQIDSFILNSSAKNIAALVFPTQRQLDKILQAEEKNKSAILASIQKSKVIYCQLTKALNQYLKYFNIDSEKEK